MVKCKFCKKAISEKAVTCHHCDRKTSSKKWGMPIMGVLAAAIGLLWFFVGDGRVRMLDFFYRDGFTVLAKEELTVVPLSEFMINNSEHNPFASRRNFFHGMDVHVINNAIVLAQNRNLVAFAMTDLTDMSVLYHAEDIRGRITHFISYEGMVYLSGLNGNIYRLDLQTGENLGPVTADVTNIIDSMAIDGNRLLHRYHLWSFYHHRPHPRRDGNVYVTNIETGDVDLLLPGEVRGIREFYVNHDEQRIVFARGSHIYQSDLYGGNVELVTDQFLHYNRMSPEDQYGWTYNGSMVFWIDSVDWTGIQASVYGLDLATGQQHYFGRIANASRLHVLGDYVLVSTTEGTLYAIDYGQQQRRPIADNVLNFAVVGDAIITVQRGSATFHLVDLLGHTAIFQ